MDAGGLAQVQSASEASRVVAAPDGPLLKPLAGRVGGRLACAQHVTDLQGQFSLHTQDAIVNVTIHYALVMLYN